MSFNVDGLFISSDANTLVDILAAHLERTGEIPFSNSSSGDAVGATYGVDEALNALERAMSAMAGRPMHPSFAMSMFQHALSEAQRMM